MFLGFHHLYKRVRESGGAKKTESLGRFVKVAIFDQLAMLVGILTSFFNLPQLLGIWVNKNTQGVSLLSWSGFTITTLFWLSYAILHRERALIVTFSIALTFQSLIVIGLLVN